MYMAESVECRSGTGFDVICRQPFPKARGINFQAYKQFPWHIVAGLTAASSLITFYF